MCDLSNLLKQVGQVEWYGSLLNRIVSAAFVIDLVWFMQLSVVREHFEVEQIKWCRTSSSRLNGVRWDWRKKVTYEIGLLIIELLNVLNN